MKISRVMWLSGKIKRKKKSITVLWVKFCLPPNLHVDAAKYRVIKNLQRGSQAAVRSLGGPNPGWLVPLEKAATWTRPDARGGWAVCQMGGGADGADSAGTLRSNLQPPEPSQRVALCYSTQVNSHTQPAMLRSSQEGKYGDSSYLLAVSQETIKRGHLVGGGEWSWGQSGSEASECGVSVFLWSVNCASTDFLNKKLKLN